MNSPTESDLFLKAAQDLILSQMQSQMQSEAGNTNLQAHPRPIPYIAPKPEPKVVSKVNRGELAKDNPQLKIPTSSIFYGVSRNQTRWMASMRLNGRTSTFGSFEDELTAAHVVDTMLERFGVEKKYRNFVNGKPNNWETLYAMKRGGKVARALKVALGKAKGKIIPSLSFWTSVTSSSMDPSFNAPSEEAEQDEILDVQQAAVGTDCDNALFAYLERKKSRRRRLKATLKNRRRSSPSKDVKTGAIPTDGQENIRNPKRRQETLVANSQAKRARN